MHDRRLTEPAASPSAGDMTHDGDSPESNGAVPHGDSGRFAWDVFISFRHKDARGPARALRLALLRWRLPAGIPAMVSGLPRIYLDTYQGVVTGDYWTENIEPALRTSRYLIVLISPSVFEPLGDGSDNWVIQELRTFLATPQGRNIIPVFTRDMREAKLPTVLSAALPRVQTFNLGSRDSFMPTVPFLETPGRFEVLRIAAAVRGVPPASQPLLFREEWRRKVRALVAVSVGALGVLAAVASGAVLAVINGVAAARTAARADMALAVNAAQEKPDEAALHAARALHTVTSTALFRPFLGEDEHRIRAVLGSLVLPRSIIRWPGGRVEHMLLSPGSERLVVLTENRVLAVYSARTLAELYRRPLVDFDGLSSIAFAGDSIVVMATRSDAVRIATVDRAGLQHAGPTIAAGDQAELLTDGRVLHRSGTSGTLALIDPISGQRRPLGSATVGPIEAVALVPTADRLVLHTRLEGPGEYEQHIVSLTDGSRIGSPAKTAQLMPYPVIVPGEWTVLRHAGATIVRVALANGRPAGEIPSPLGLHAHAAYVSPDGKLAIVSRAWRGGLFEVWSLPEARQLAPPLSPLTLAKEPIFSTSASKVALMTPTGVVVLDRNQPATPLLIPREGGGGEARFIGDDRFLVTADLGGRVSVWNLATGDASLRGIRHHEGMVSLLALPDGRLASGGWDGSVRSTDLSDGREPVWTVPAPEGGSSSVTALAAHPGSEDVAFATQQDVARCMVGRTPCRWRQPLPRAALSLAFADTGHVLIVSLRDGGATILNAETGAELAGYATGAVAGSGSGSSPFIAVAQDGAPLRLMRAAGSGTPVCVGNVVLRTPQHARMTADGTLIVVISAGDKGDTVLSAFRSSDCSRTWSAPIGFGVVKLTVSDMHGFAAVGGNSGGALYRLSDGASWPSQLDDRNMLSDVVFASRQPLLLTLGVSGRITVYDLASGERHFTPIEAQSIPWNAVFSPSDHLFAVSFITGNQRGQFLAQLFETELGRPLSPPLLHPQDVLAITITASGRYVVTGCADGAVRAWRIDEDRRPLVDLLAALTEATGQTIDLGTGAVRASRAPAINQDFSP